MIDFLFKSTVSLGVFLGLYHLLLEREKMHTFNRFYLLGALVLSLIIPFITIPVYIEAAASPQETAIHAITGGTIASQPVSNINYWPYILSTLYTLITLVLIIRFAINIMKFGSKAATNTTVRYAGATLVLLNEKTLPHTFLNYIFVNRKEYEKGIIEQDLYTHELVHVHQKHTVDILIVEALKTLFWFNPLLYCYKKAIQLNHEFLADDAVVKATNDTRHYQELLLQTASSGYSPSLASSLNFSLTKKRFIMMTRSTSKTKKLMFQALVLPVICSLTLFLCTETIAQQIPITVNHTAGGKIEVFTPTQKEIDSLRQVDPVKYKDEPNTRIMRTDYTLTENGKEKVVTKYDKSRDYKSELSERTKSGLAGIDPAKMKSINVNNVTQAEMDSLKIAEPEHYKNALATDFKSITVVYLDNEGKQVKKTYYESNAPLNSNATTIEPDKQPEFSEGSFSSFVLKNMIMPDVKENINVRVYVSFIVEADGSVTNVKILRDPGYGLGDAVKKAVEGSPKWIPGSKDGKPVRVSYSLPVIIRVTK